MNHSDNRALAPEGAGGRWGILPSVGYGEIRMADEDSGIGFSLTADDGPSLARALEIWARIPPAEREILLQAFSSAGASQVKNPTPQNGHRYRGTRLPETFQPPEEWIAWATQLGVTRGRALQHFAQFRDYWAAVPGKEGVKLSWFATWKNRCRSLADAGRL